MKEIPLDQSNELGRFLSSSFQGATPEHRLEARRFAYRRPEIGNGKSRAVVRLATTDILFSIVQVFETGGETMRHSHSGMDGFWLVLKGTARFYIADDPPFDVNEMDGLCIPRGVEYWFETVGDVPLEILQVDALHPNIRNKLNVANPEGPRTDKSTISVLDGRD